MARRNFVIVHQILALSVEDILEAFHRGNIRTWQCCPLQRGVRCLKYSFREVQLLNCIGNYTGKHKTKKD